MHAFTTHERIGVGLSKAENVRKRREREFPHTDGGGGDTTYRNTSTAADPQAFAYGTHWKRFSMATVGIY